MNEHPKTISIIGAGVAGLVAARQSRIRFPEARVLLLEASDRAGGILQTEKVDGYHIETAADMFTTEPDNALKLCQSLGCESDLLTTRPVQSRAFVATESGIEPVPAGLSLMLPGNQDAIRESRLLDDAGTERFFQEQSVAANNVDTDEDLQSFVVRRFGQQAFDRIFQPLVSGIYTADPKRLSMRATMQRFIDLEQSHGSLIAAAQAKQGSAGDRGASGARYDLFRAPRDGMGALIDWLIDSLDGVEILYNCPVDSIRQVGAGWQILTRAQQIEASAVLLATPSHAAARILQGHDATLAAAIGSIESASAAVIVVAFDEAQIREKFDGYGIVIPAYLRRKLIAASFSSNKFDNRAPAGKVLVRCFAGGALQRELVDLSDSQLVALAVSELDRLIGIEGQPEMERVFRWRDAMPQYHLGHLDRVDEIESLVARYPTLQLAGNSYRGVGIPVCVRSGTEAVERLVTQE